MEEEEKMKKKGCEQKKGGLLVVTSPTRLPSSGALFRGERDRGSDCAAPFL